MAEETTPPGPLWAVVDAQARVFTACQDEEIARRAKPHPEWGPFRVVEYRPASEVERLNERIKALREALAFYADDDNYDSDQAPCERVDMPVPQAVWPNDVETEWEPDRGERARTALAADDRTRGGETA